MLFWNINRKYNRNEVFHVFVPYIWFHGQPSRKTYPNPSINNDMFIRKALCAKDKIIEAQNIMTMVTGIDPLRPFASIIIPNKNAPKVVPIWKMNLFAKIVYSNREKSKVTLPRCVL